MELLLLNGVYGAPEHFDRLREALAPDVATAVLPFRREGLPFPVRHRGFAHLIPRLEKAIDALASSGNGRPPALFGFSLGGALALEYALTWPERVSALVLVNSFARFQRGPMQASSMPAVWSWPPAWAHPRLTAHIVHRNEWLRRGLFHGEAPREAIERSVRAATIATTQDDLRYQLAHLDLGSPEPLAPALGALARRIPVLLLSSRDDLVVPPRHTDWLASRMPAARRLPPLEGGHAFFQHDSRRLAGIVREFLESGPSR